MNIPATRLTAMAHGGGCGCKLAPSVLHDILKRMPVPLPCADILVGRDTADHAAVYRLNETQAIIATTDFFTPIVDDPFDFGRIAATNALSDVYAMGGTPLFALAIVGMPVGKMPLETVQAILAGGASTCADAGIAVIGGHSIDTPEPIYGLVAIGLVAPDKVLTNAGARPGDDLVLSKGLGVGIFSAALKKGVLNEGGYKTMLDSTTKLNAVGAKLADFPGVHAVTDVTGFGLLGHLLEMCRGAGVAARLDIEAIPVLPGAQSLWEAGHLTGAATRNWDSYGHDVQWPEDGSNWPRDLFCDPQTSGGLLIAANPDVVQDLLQLLRDAGFDQAARIGNIESGRAGVIFHK